MFPLHEYACFLLEVPRILLNKKCQAKKECSFFTVKSIWKLYFSVFLSSCLPRLIILITSCSLQVNTNNVVSCSASQVVSSFSVVGPWFFIFISSVTIQPMFINLLLLPILLCCRLGSFLLLLTAAHAINILFIPILLITGLHQQRKDKG